jgi:hypothetical protein
VEVHLAVVLGLREQVVERGVLHRAGEVLQLERGAAVVKVSCHAQQRRDADAAGEQQVVLRGLVDLEVVAGREDLQRVAFGHAVRA